MVARTNNHPTILRTLEESFFQVGSICPQGCTDFSQADFAIVSQKKTILLNLLGFERLYNLRICFLKENIAHLEDEVTTDDRFPSPIGSMDLPDPEELQQLPPDQFYLPEEDVDVSDGTLTQPRSLSDSEEHKAYLTVQPNRILCGVSIRDSF